MIGRGPGGYVAAIRAASGFERAHVGTAGQHTYSSRKRNPTSSWGFLLRWVQLAGAGAPPVC